MPDISTISAILTSLKTATEIVKLIRESDTSLEKAEVKLRLAELINALADAKIQVSEIQAELIAKDSEILQLSEALETKADVVRFYDGVYQKNPQGLATGQPYCLSCWNDRNKLRVLVQAHNDLNAHVCTSCNHKYSKRLTPRSADHARQANA